MPTVGNEGSRVASARRAMRVDTEEASATAKRRRREERMTNTLNEETEGWDGGRRKTSQSSSWTTRSKSVTSAAFLLHSDVSAREAAGSNRGNQNSKTVSMRKTIDKLARGTDPPEGGVHQERSAEVFPEP